MERLRRPRIIASAPEMTDTSSDGAVVVAPKLPYKNPGSEVKTFTSSDADVLRGSFFADAESTDEVVDPEIIDMFFKEVPVSVNSDESIVFQEE